jgi:AraC family ethanolamine operon transcriptional activator
VLWISALAGFADFTLPVNADTVGLRSRAETFHFDAASFSLAAARPMTEAQTLHGSYGSLEECCHMIEALGWETQWRQLDLARGLSDLRVVSTQQTGVMRLDLNNRMHQRAVPIKGCRTFGIPVRQQTPGKLGCRVMDTGSLIYMDPYHGLDAVVEPGFTAFTIAIREEQLAEMAALYELPDPLSHAAKPGSARVLKHRQSIALNSTLQNILQLAEAGCGPDLIRQQLDLELPGMLLRNWFATHESPSHSANNRSRAVSRALEYLAAFPRESLTVEQLCTASATSISTLERAFAARFGVSPKRYLLLSRLTNVRRALLDPDETRSITDIANEWGFWHMGKFAADYKRQFGQLPSQTLAAAA